MTVSTRLYSTVVPVRLPVNECNESGRLIQYSNETVLHVRRPVVPHEPIAVFRNRMHLAMNDGNHSITISPSHRHWQRCQLKVREKGQAGSSLGPLR